MALLQGRNIVLDRRKGQRKIVSNCEAREGERKTGTLRGTETGGVCGSMASIAPLNEDGKWVCHPQSPHYGIWIKLLILFEPKLQRAVNYTWKIVWARPLADGKTMVANEVSRLPRGKSFYAFPLWCFESLHGESMPESSLGHFSIMNKTTIKKTNKSNNDNLFAFCRLKRQISFSQEIATGFNSWWLGLE